MRRRLALAIGLALSFTASAAPAAEPARQADPKAATTAASTTAAAATTVATARWLPAVRTRAWLTTSEERLRQAGVPRGKGLGAVTALNDQLVSVIVEDLAESTRFITVDEIAATGLSVEQAKLRALDNLRTVRPRMALEGKNGRFRVVGASRFESSLALDEAWLRDKALGLQGDPVVAMPSATMIFITDTRNAAALLGLRGVVSRLYTEAGESGLSPELFVWRRGQLEILPVP